VERVVPNALALVRHRLPEKAIHLPDFLIQKFEVSGREPVPKEDPDRDDWKRANRD
jgi:hypothetical protein